MGDDARIDKSGYDSFEGEKQFTRHQCGLLREKDFHFHVPEGATPKDGPSAGIGMCLAMASALTGIRVKKECCYDWRDHSERGGIANWWSKRKIPLAAQRGGIKTVLIPGGERKRS